VRVLTDLLIMGKVGVYVDNSVLSGPDARDSLHARPYLYSYPIENVLSFSCTNPEEPSEFQTSCCATRALSTTN